MSNSDLTARFALSGLPRSALAAFLGLDNALISRLAAGQRSWRPDEYDRASAFFDLVPEGYGPLVRRLRRRETRLLVGPTLADTLVRLGHRTAFGVSLRAVAEGLIELRADQIVALCRKFRVDLFHLTMGRGMKKGSWPKNDSAIVNYEEACRMLAAKQGRRDERLRRGRHLKSTPESRRSIGPSLSERIAACQPFTVTDDELEPRYRRGEIIYVDGSGRECRYGDDVVILREEEGGPVIGMLMAIGPGSVSVQTPKQGRVVVPAAEIRSMRRISFTER